LDQVAGVHPRDPKSLPAPTRPYLQALAEGLPAGLRVGYSPDLGYATVQADIAEASYDAARVFESLGHKFTEISGGPPQVGREWGLMGGLELAAKLHHLLPKHEDQFGRAFLRGVKSGWEMTPEMFGEAEVSRMRLCNWIADVFEKVDLLLTPTIPFDPPPAKGPFPRATEGRPQLAWGVASFTIPFNLSWHPAATVRTGLSRAGLPMGLQIVGPRHCDDLVLQAAQAFERERPWHPHWPTRW
jgi:aspartyl-tRNA(Asn)/glutamyl-tRNA(Gln) amidotransferase subunit A